MGCGLCEFETNYKKELTYHNMKTHNEKDTLYCNQCNFKMISKIKLKEHMEVKHSNKIPVCNFYLVNWCTCQGCTFRHEKQETSNHKGSKQKCKRGGTCYYKSQNECFYFHPEDEVQIVSKAYHEQTKNQRPHEATSQNLWCKYQEACTKNSCPFKHFQNNTVKSTQKFSCSKGTNRFFSTLL